MGSNGRLAAGVVAGLTGIFMRLIDLPQTMSAYSKHSGQIPMRASVLV